MPFQIVRNDITKMQVDAIVNAANCSLLGGGGVDGCIHRAAGPELLAECRTLGGCRTGDAKITKGYRLPAKYVIHTVGPIWEDGRHGERALLVSCYRRSLELAKEYGLESVAFPLISAGAYGYPKDQALQTALSTIQEFLMTEEMQVYLVIFDRGAFQIGRKLRADIASYIDDRYAEEHRDLSSAELRGAQEGWTPPPAAARRTVREDRKRQKKHQEEMRFYDAAVECSPVPSQAARRFDEDELAELIKNLDEGFSVTLLHLIDRRGMTDAECYKKANIDRRLFSKIRSDPQYRPSKSTALAFAVALELSLPETEDLLKRAGYALSDSNVTDLIVEYFIDNGNYDIYQLNAALFAFDQATLGNAVK